MAADGPSSEKPIPLGISLARTHRESRRGEQALDTGLHAVVAVPHQDERAPGRFHAHGVRRRSVLRKRSSLTEKHDEPPIVRREFPLVVNSGNQPSHKG